MKVNHSLIAKELFGQLADAIITLSPGGNVPVWNQATTEMLAIHVVREASRARIWQFQPTA